MLRGPVRALAEGPTGTPPAPSRFGDFWPKGDGLLWGRGGAKADDHPKYEPKFPLDRLQWRLSLAISKYAKDFTPELVPTQCALLRASDPLTSLLRRRRKSFWSFAGALFGKRLLSSCGSRFKS